MSDAAWSMRAEPPFTREVLLVRPSPTLTTLPRRRYPDLPDDLLAEDLRRVG